MSDEHLPSVPVGLVAARIVEAGLLFHRQAVEFGAHHDGGAVAIPVDGDQPGLADIFGNFEAERAHLRGEPGCGFHFLKGKFGMGVELLVERIELWIVARDRRLIAFLRLMTSSSAWAGSRLAANSAADTARDL